MKTPKKTQGTAAQKTTAVTSSIGTGASASTQDAAALLKADHRKVEGLFQSYQQAAGDEQKSSIALQVCKELIIHTKIEEEIFYPACREKNVEDAALDEAQVEHDGAKILITELMTDSPSDQYYDAKLKVLSEYIKHHVAEEENPKEGIFAKAQKAGVDMNALGQKLQARKTQLMEQGDVMSPPPEPQSLHIFENFQESDMARQNERERDDNGRFMSDDDDNRGRSRGYSSQNRYQGNDDNSRYSRERDENGRFVSDDDDNRSRSYASRADYDDDRSSRGRDENGRFTGSNSDDDGRYARNRDDDGRFSSNYDDGYRGNSSNRGDNRGWYGDSEGHSRAAQQRGGYRSSSDRSRDDDGRYSSDRGNGGRSDGGQSDNGRNGSSGDGRGWYGDSEGHSRAAQQRGNYRSSSSRDSRDDDNRRSSSSSNRGGSSQNGDGRGWYGDSRGHAAAARRGWEDR